MSELKLHGPYTTDDFGVYVYGTDKDGDANIVIDIRGWGYLTGKGSGALALPDAEAIAEQQAFARHVVAALNAYESPTP
jgi:hypothetical protein